MTKPKPSKQDAAKAAIAAKLDAVALDKESDLAHARWITGSALDMSRPLSDELRSAVATLVEESAWLAKDRETIKSNNDGICNTITGLFFEHVVQGGDPATLNLDICLQFGWPLKTFLACGKEINISGTGEKKPATFGQVMSKVGKVYSVDGTMPRLYTSKDKMLSSVVKRYAAIKSGEITAFSHVDKPQKASAKAINEHGPKMTLPEMKALRAENKRQGDQMDEMIRLADQKD